MSTSAKLIFFCGKMAAGKSTLARDLAAREWWLDVTLAYLKGKDAESEEAQEHANSSSVALFA